jgi:hypothetical protein
VEERKEEGRLREEAQEKLRLHVEKRAEDLKNIKLWPTCSDAV